MAKKKAPEVTIPEEFKFYRQRDYLAVRLNEAYVDYEKAAADFSRMSKSGLAVSQVEAQKAAIKVQIEGDNLRTQCQAIVAESAIDSRDVLYAIVSELRKINSRYDSLHAAERPRRLVKDAPGESPPWKHPLDSDHPERVGPDYLAKHDLTGSWPPPLCPDCADCMKVSEWNEDGTPKIWACDFHTHKEPVLLSEANIQRCRVCRCIQVWPCIRCSETCHWVERNLCSACNEEALAVCEFLVPHAANRASLCENEEVISGRKECEHYDGTDHECMKKAGLNLKYQHPELHEQVQEELDRVDEKNGEEEKVVQSSESIMDVDDKDGGGEDQEETKSLCPVCGGVLIHKKITAAKGKAITAGLFCEKCEKFCEEGG